MSHDFLKDAEFIGHVGSLAGAELMRRFGGVLDVSAKADASIVTDADLASERVILEAIRTSYPNDRILSEESGLSSEGQDEGSFIWIVDPLDGTSNFANRYPFFSVSIARGRFRADGSIEVVAGGVIDPTRQVAYLASLGGGATRNGKPMRVAPQRELKDAFLVTGFYYFKGKELEADVSRFLDVAQQCQTIRRDGSAALDLALVADGIYDAFWERGLMPWDVAAGFLLVTEAGGAVAHYDGTEANVAGVRSQGLIGGSKGAIKSLLPWLGRRSPR